MEGIHREYLTPDATDVLKSSQHIPPPPPHYQRLMPYDKSLRSSRRKLLPLQTAVNPIHVVVRRLVFFPTKPSVKSIITAHPPVEGFIALQRRETVGVAGEALQI